MGAFDRIYSDEQREAAERAYVPHKVTATKVAELAASGQLKRSDGTCLEPFTISPHTVRKLHDRARQQSLGNVPSPLADLEHRDAVEILRRRLINLADAELTHLERKPRGKRDVARGRQIAQLAREAAAIPGPDDPRPSKPGSNAGGTQNGSRTRSKLAGSILHAARGGTAQDHPPQHLEGEDAHAHLAVAEYDDVIRAAQSDVQTHTLPGGGARERNASAAMAQL